MLSVRDAVVVERLLRLYLHGDRFTNPLVFSEYQKAAEAAMPKLEMQVRTALQKRGKG